MRSIGNGLWNVNQKVGLVIISLLILVGMDGMEEEKVEHQKIKQ